MTFLHGNAFEVVLAPIRKSRFPQFKKNDLFLDHGFAAGIDLIKTQESNEIRISSLSLKDQERLQLMLGILSDFLHERGKRLFCLIPDRNVQSS